jgi:transposase-like protein
MSLRSEFVLFASQDGANLRALCRHFNISPSTGYKWLRRWTEEGAAGLADRSVRLSIRPGEPMTV